MQEIWKDIKGYENLYQVSNLGNVKNKNFIGSVLNILKHLVILDRLVDIFGTVLIKALCKTYNYIGGFPLMLVSKDD